jgi:predicted metal-dependent phosphoesterase TrpH
MFLIDLHVHTRRFSPCAELLDPKHLAQRIRLKGISGVVLAEHDALWEAADIKALNHELGEIRIYRGAEISTNIGHVVVVGLDHLCGITPGIDMEALVAIAHHHAAAAIVVHPQQLYRRTGQSLQFWQVPSRIDAIEVASSATRGHQRCLLHAMALRCGWHAVAGSDAHYLEQVGCCVTGFDHLPADEHELAQLIRTGQGVALSLENGEPSLISHVV